MSFVFQHGLISRAAVTAAHSHVYIAGNVGPVMVSTHGVIKASLCGVSGKRRVVHQCKDLLT